MKQTNISLTKPQVEQLTKQADLTGLSKSEIIRRALDRYFLNDPEDSIEKAWASEARRRLDQVRNGEVRALPGDQVHRELREKHTK